MIRINLKYCNPTLNIAFSTWNEVYLMGDVPVKLKPAYYRGSHIYRLPATGKRISYKKLKQGMLLKPTILQSQLLPVYDKIKWL